MNWPDDFIVFRNKGYVFIKCRHCRKIFKIFRSRLNQGRGQFCSKICTQKFHSKRMAGKKNPNYKNALIQKKCLTCSNEFKTFLSINSNYCSNKCRQTDHGNKIKAEKHPNWKGGIGKKSYPYEFNEKLKESMRKRDGHRCQKCFIHQSKLKRKLDVHHIDGNKGNLSPQNLISLCESCHIKLERNNGKTNLATGLY